MPFKLETARIYGRFGAVDVPVALDAAGRVYVVGDPSNPVWVAGPLTDAQLRAAAVVVSGPLTDAQLRAAAVPVVGPVTDVQLRASPLPVSGPLTDAQLRALAVAVSGPLTDAQLRASPVPVTATGTTTVAGTVAQGSPNAGGADAWHVQGPLTDAQLRAAAVAVSGPLTDAQLRASAVPVSGPLTDAQLRALAVAVAGPLTDAELRASPVPVSGPLTDAQLRAAAVPVSGFPNPVGVKGSDLATIAAPGNGTVGSGNGLPVRPDMLAGTPLGLNEAVYMAGTIRNDVPAALTPTNGRSSFLSVDQMGAAWMRPRVLPRWSQSPGRTPFSINGAFGAGTGGLLTTIAAGTTLYITACWISAARDSQTTAAFANLEFDTGPGLIYPLRALVPGASLFALGATSQEGVANVHAFYGEEGFPCVVGAGTGAGELRLVSGSTMAAMACGVVGYTITSGSGS